MSKDKYTEESLGYLFEGTTDFPEDGQYHMEYYLRNIPKYLNSILNNSDFVESLDSIAEAFLSVPGGNFVFSGCGTSFHAVLVAKYIFESITGLPIIAIDPFSIVNYPSPWIKSDTILLILSHSGRSKIVAQATELAKSKGAKVIGMTGLLDSPLAQNSNMSIITPGGRESCLPKTKSYLCALMSLYLLALKVAKKNGFKSHEEIQKLEEEIYAVPKIIESVSFSMDEKIKKLAQEWGGKKGAYYFIGSGPNYATAQEVALKFKETNFEIAEGEDIEEMAHGPIVLLDSDSVLITIAPDGPAEKRAIDIVKAANIVGASTLVLSTRKSKVCNEASDYLIFPDEVSEIISPLVYVVPLYFLTYYIALAKKVNPDFCRTDIPKYAKCLKLVFPKGSH